MSSKTTCIAWTSGASVRAVAGFAAFVAYRGFHSRAIVSVVTFRLERALAISALVLRTGEALGQVRYITRPKSETMRVTRQLGLPPRYRGA